MRKVNGCLKGINLENIFQNLLWEKNLIKFLIIFYIPHKSSIKFFLKQSVNKCSNDTYIYIYIYIYITFLLNMKQIEQSHKITLKYNKFELNLLYFTISFRIIFY